VPQRTYQRSLVDFETHEIGMIEMLRRALDPASGRRGDAPVQPLGLRERGGGCGGTLDAEPAPAWRLATQRAAAGHPGAS
jgi:hypothetical protein